MAAHVNIADTTGLALFIAKIRSNSTNKRTVVGLHIDWKSDEFFKCSNVTVALCAGLECVIVPAQDHLCDRWSFCSSSVEFLDDSDVYFVGVDIHNSMKKIGMQCRNAVEIRGLAAQLLGRPQLGVLNVLDLAREVVGLQVAKPRREMMEYCSTHSYAAFLVGDRLISLDTKKAKLVAKPKAKAAR